MPYIIGQVLICIYPGHDRSQHKSYEHTRKDEKKDEVGTCKPSKQIGAFADRSCKYEGTGFMLEIP